MDKKEYVRNTETQDGSLCFLLSCISVPGRAEALPGVFFAGKLADFAGKHREINASRGTQRTVLCVRCLRSAAAFTDADGINPLWGR